MSNRGGVRIYLFWLSGSLLLQWVWKHSWLRSVPCSTYLVSDLGQRKVLSVSIAQTSPLKCFLTPGRTSPSVSSFVPHRLTRRPNKSLLCHLCNVFGDLTCNGEQETWSVLPSFCLCLRWISSLVSTLPNHTYEVGFDDETCIPIYHKQEPLVSLAICTIWLLRQLGLLLRLRPEID